MKSKQIQLLLVCLWTSGSTFADLTQGLVTHYPFDGNADDVGTNQNNGTLHGGVSLAADHNGKPNGAYHFNGTDGFIAASSTHLPTGERTVVVSFRANALNNRPILLGYGGSGVCGTSWIMGVNNAGDPLTINRFYVSGHCNVHSLGWEYSPDRVINHWVQLAITTQAKGTAIYVNGDKKIGNNQFFTDTPSAGKTLSIGINTDFSGATNSSCTVDHNIGCFSGDIDDIKIYNRALSKDEMRQLYYQDFPPQIHGSAPWVTAHSVSCNNITQGTAILIPQTSASAWDCEKAGLQINSGDQVSVTIEGTKY